uniref:Uncharacterized protein n=1 Tax=Anopheles coluzzii TaxID=1518534 RepID=A0A8W7Q319_ANOCL
MNWYSSVVSAVRFRHWVCQCRNRSPPPVWEMVTPPSSPFGPPESLIVLSRNGFPFVPFTIVIGKPGPVLYFTIKSVTLSWSKWPGTIELTLSESATVNDHSCVRFTPSNAYTVELNELTTMSCTPSPFRSVSTAGTMKPDDSSRTIGSNALSPGYFMRFSRRSTYTPPGEFWPPVTTRNASAPVVGPVLDVATVGALRFLHVYGEDVGDAVAVQIGHHVDRVQVDADLGVAFQVGVVLQLPQDAAVAPVQCQYEAAAPGRHTVGPTVRVDVDVALEREDRERGPPLPERLAIETVQCEQPAAAQIGDAGFARRALGDVAADALVHQLVDAVPDDHVLHAVPVHVQLAEWAFAVDAGNDPRPHALHGDLRAGDHLQRAVEGAGVGVAYAPVRTGNGSQHFQHFRRRYFFRMGLEERTPPALPPQPTPPLPLPLVALPYRVRLGAMSGRFAPRSSYVRQVRPSRMNTSSSTSSLRSSSMLRLTLSRTTSCSDGWYGFIFFRISSIVAAWTARPPFRPAASPNRPLTKPDMPAVAPLPVEPFCSILSSSEGKSTKLRARSKNSGLAGIGSISGISLNTFGLREFSVASSLYTVSSAVSSSSTLYAWAENLQPSIVAISCFSSPRRSKSLHGVLLLDASLAYLRDRSYMATASRQRFIATSVMAM